MGAGTTERALNAGVAELTAVVDQLVVGADRDDLVAGFAARDRLDVVLALAVADFDAAARYEDDGDLTASRWLVHHCGLDPASASRVVRTGRRLKVWPTTAAAARDGRLSGGQLDVIVANVGLHAGLFADHEAALVPELGALSPRHINDSVCAWLLMWRWSRSRR